MKGLTALLLLTVILAALAPPASADPEWVPFDSGKVTWYHLPGRLTRSEEMYYSSSATAAVDASRWGLLKGQRIRVTNQVTGASMVVRVNDTGYLAGAGVVLDLPRDTHARLGAGVFQGHLDLWFTAGQSGWR